MRTSACQRALERGLEARFLPFSVDDGFDPDVRRRSDKRQGSDLVGVVGTLDDAPAERQLRNPGRPGQPPREPFGEPRVAELRASTFSCGASSLRNAEQTACHTALRVSEPAGKPTCAR